MSRNKAWTTAEEKYLEENFNKLELEAIADHLKRPKNSVEIKSRRMHLTLSEMEKDLAADEKKVLKFISGRNKAKTKLEIADHIDRSPTTVDTILQILTDKHYNINIKEEHDRVSLMETPVTGGKKIINVEEYFGSAREVAFGIVSDLHYASIYAREELTQLMYDIFKREGIETVFECGNMIDGEIFFNMRELLAYGVKGQVDYFVKHVPQVEGITTYFITGDDHEGWLARKAGINIGEVIEDAMRRAGRNDWQFLSHIESDVQFKTKRGSSIVRLTHPGGGSSYALSYQPQKIIESLQGGTKPHVLIEGHLHKSMYAMIRNVHSVLAGCFEDQTSFMRKKHIEAHIGGWIIRMTLGEDGSILKFQPNWYPFFDKKVYDVNKDYPVMSHELNEAKEGKPSRIF